MDPAERDRIAALDRKVAALRTDYRRALPEQLDALAALLAAVAHPGAVDAVEAAWQLAHRLKGTTGSYGFAALAEQLEAIEEILERPRRERLPVSDDDRERALSALGRARAALS